VHLENLVKAQGKMLEMLDSFVVTVYFKTVVDPLTSILVYYGSFSAIDEAVCAEVLESFVRKGFAESDMVPTPPAE
jgi:hypothetical protein